MDLKKVTRGVSVAATVGLAAANAIKAVGYVPEKIESEPLPPENVNVERYTKNLVDAVRIKTISNVDESKVDWDAFNELHNFFRERYPLIHKTLSLEEVGKASLIYKWEGKNPDLEPIALLGHQDVVPISEGTEGDWLHDPFGGEIADGCLWGRGSLDMKNHLVGVLESVETLIEEGFEPERTVYLLFGHNEEIVASKNPGAGQICELLKSRGVRLDSVLDEGGAILPVNVKGVINKNLAGVGVAEKGYCDFQVSIPGKGGHSSAPPNHTALGELADVIKDIENHQFKAELTPITEGMIDCIGRNASFLVRNVMCHTTLMSPVIKFVMKNIPASATFVRTTTAVTMASGSPAANVLPGKASATVNFRIMPGMTIDDVERHLEKVIKNKKVEIELLGGSNPSNISPTDSRAFNAIKEICTGMNSKNVVAPYLVMGGTDAKHYQDICDNIYRYSPFMVDTRLLMNTHGTNERIETASFKDGIAFFKRYIKKLARQ